MQRAIGSNYFWDVNYGELYLKTWELDNETFEEKDRLTKDQAMEWFYSSEKSIIVLWNEKEKELVGYLYPFLLKHEFARDYILSDVNYKEAIKPSVFCKKKKRCFCRYIYF